MDSTITVAVIAGSVSAVGWLVNHALSGRAERKRARHQAALTHVERQLEELYGPLLFLMHEGESSFSDFTQTVGGHAVFVNEQIEPDNLQPWLFWVDNDFMPRNRAIQTLLSTKAHLIDASRMPASYLQFLDHHNSWHVSHLRWKEDGVPYRWHSRTGWPRDFQSDVIATYERLKRYQKEISGILTAP
ncbi:hypothetical protein ABZW18_25990 [Streptomyces sp. NPDC004647]|uniref:hypothetical protein n=1 Tax=Streptomyces sp. NPDC004647 TaxID=3154671 RepID=UPI0033A1A3D9